MKKLPPIRSDLEMEVVFATKLKGMSVDELERELGFCCCVRQGSRTREAKIAYELLRRLKAGS